MIQTEIELANPQDDKFYLPAFDIIRAVCIGLIIIFEFGLYFIPFSSYFQSLLNFAPCTLFTIYGYTVLKDGNDLRKYIKHTFKVFTIMFVIYALLTSGYMWITSGDFLYGINKWRIFNFLVLNFWGLDFCSSIWYIQSALYALIIFWLFRKLKNYDWLFCIIFFIVGILVGEFAYLINFNFLGNAFIPGNFLTRTMPYMLLGRLINNYYNEIIAHLKHSPFVYIVWGFLLALIEYAALLFTGNLIYSNHFIGFILISAFLCIVGVVNPMEEQAELIQAYLPSIYKGMFYVYNPLGNLLILASAYFCTTTKSLDTCLSLVGAFVLIFTFTFFWVWALIKDKSNYDKAMNGDSERL